MQPAPPPAQRHLVLDSGPLLEALSLLSNPQEQPLLSLPLQGNAQFSLWPKAALRAVCGTAAP